MSVPKTAYIEEAQELLADLETALLELEAAPDDANLVGRVFRDLHTIKGSGAMFGFDQVALFTHDVENAFDLVREGRLAVTQRLIELALAARDRIKTLIEIGADGGTADDTDSATITGALRELAGGATAARAAGTPQPAAPRAAAPSGERTYRVHFRPHADILQNGTNPILLLRELEAMGTTTIVPLNSSIPQLFDADPEACHVEWEVLLTTAQGIDAVRDVFMFVDHLADIGIDEMAGAVDADGQPIAMRLGEILMARGDITPEELHRVLAGQRKLGELLISTGTVAESRVSSALAEQKHVKDVREKRQKSESVGSIRVASEKLDRLVNLVGELVTVQARLGAFSATQGRGELTAIAETVERLTEELRDNAMSIRMMPIGSTFAQYQRLVRDISREMGKQILLTTEGAETELDKTVIERLNDPLVHLIRNSCDHGIETPEARRASGKPDQGTIRLSAVHSGAHVLITIADDGAGLDREVIRAKAVEKGLITADAPLTEEDTFGLIFAPGFSTARQVTNLSGRGVGMDVVRRTTEALRGSVSVASVKGRGTTITLKFPLTLAIIDGLLVRVGQGAFVLPLAVVEECVELPSHDRIRDGANHLARVRGELVPYIRLREQFWTEGDEPAIEQIVIANVNGLRVGFVVDHVIGQHQTVIKSLGRFYRQAELVSGATILGDGTPALILDLPKLVRTVEAGQLVAQPA
jgi:two-component system, chemotaxis family, sensor kinase CheA